MTNPAWPIAIDPVGCGCTECMTGEYVPLEDASSRDIYDMLMGYVGNNTGIDLDRWRSIDQKKQVERFQEEFM